MRWLRRKHAPGLVGVEIRPNQISLAWSKRVGPTASSRDLQGCLVLSANAAQRKAVLTEALEAEKLKGTFCNLVLPQEQYQIFQIDKPSVEAHELADAVRWKIKDLIDYPIDDAIIDVFAFPADAMRSRTPVVNVVCARKVMLSDQVSLLKDVGLELQCIDIAELAMRNVAMRFDPEAKGIALLYLRGNQGTVMMCKAGELYFYRRVDFEVATLNDLNRQEEAVQQLALHVQRSLDYYESQMGQKPPMQLLVFKVSDEVALAPQLGSYLAVKVQEIGQQEMLPNAGEMGLLFNDGLIAMGAALRQEAS